MRSRTNKICAIVSGIILLTAVSVFVITCADPAGPNHASAQPGGGLPDTPDGDTRLVVAMHDAPFKMEGKDVQELNLMVYTYGYENYFRNIDIDSGRLKWGNFIDPHGFIYGMSDAIYAYLYSNVTPHRIPTEHSIMRAKYVNGFTAYGRQFGPVNRYHMEASFRIRTGIIDKDREGNDITADLNYGMRDPKTWQIVEDYEWVGYKIPDFKKEYSPEYFLTD